MKYSVLMSVYGKDSPVYLKAALESIYDNQTKKPDEIVIVQDGPVGEELNGVIEAFRSGKESVVKAVALEQNRGLGDALRAGTAYCTGDYIFRMDADDISDATRFEKQAAYMEAHPEVDVLGADIAEFEQSPDEWKQVRACPERHEDIVRMGKKRNPMNHVATCIRKESLEHCGGYEPLLLLEDYYLWLRMIAAGCRLANLHEPLVFVRVGNAFHTRRGAKERVSGWRVLQDFMLSHGMIGKREAAMNMIYIRGFVSTPAWLKKLLYRFLFRK